MSKTYLFVTSPMSEKKHRLRAELKRVDEMYRDLQTRQNELRDVADKLARSLTFHIQDKPLVGEDALKAFADYKTKFGAW